MTPRVGVGYDSHRLAVDGKPLVIGGMRIPADVGVVAHSDGDVACHALTDAILGAAALGDIGELFPNTDPANRDRDSIEMLALAVERVRAAGWAVVNADVSVVCERYRVGPHRAAIRARLGAALGVDPGAVFVKGKTNEGMGWIGRGEGLACIAVASLVRSEPAP